MSDKSIFGRASRPGTHRNDGTGRRFTFHVRPRPEIVSPLPERHPAVVGGRTYFPKAVVEAEGAPRLLVSGANSLKLGARVLKGRWRGAAIYHLTLEERATCPRSCANWRTCYGNSMPVARRHTHGPALERRLEEEVAQLARRHRRGFIVRLHTLGDFYSVAYVALWARLLARHSGLRVFGYTAWPRDSEIGAAVLALTNRSWARFAIRFSGAAPSAQGATTIWFDPGPKKVPGAILCPTQTGATACCATCGLCWASAARDKAIAFMGHGIVRRGARGHEPNLRDHLDDAVGLGQIPPAPRKP